MKKKRQNSVRLFTDTINVSSFDMLVDRGRRNTL